MKYHRKLFNVLASLMVLGSLTFLTACGSPWPSEPSTVEYAAEYGTVLPVEVVSSENVTDPDNAITGDAITLTYDVGGTAPSIVLDYGKIVGGYPQFQVVSVTGTPTLNTTFSESFDYVDTGDGTPYLENSLQPARSMNYNLSASEFVQNQLLQGSQRYQKLSLTTPGTSVTLEAVSLEATLASPNVSADDAGYFISSSSTLNDIWQVGAYTVEANRIDAYAMPSPWTLTAEGAVIASSNPSIYQNLAFHDTGSTTTFTFRVEKGGVSWTVNATFPSTVQFTLNASDDDANPNTLTGSVGGSFSDFLRAPLTPVALSTPLDPGTWHTVTTSSTPIFAGGRITVNLDGVDIVTNINPGDAIAALPPWLQDIIPPYLALGTSGFFNQEGHVSTVKNLSIVALNLDTFTPKFYAAALTDGDTTVLGDFAVDTNELSVMGEGAKRDKYVWSGDMLVFGPSLYYTTGNAEPIQGSLTLLSKYLDAEGQVASVMPSKMPLDTTGRDAGPTNPWYGLDYSMFFITNLYDYYMYTGDLSLVTSLWPQAQSEMDYLASKQDVVTNLIVTDDLNGWTWHPQFDAVQTGMVAEFNVDYVRALKHAGSLATALGMTTEAASYAAMATTVTDAINANLFNAVTGVYDISDTKTGYVAQDANSKAVLFGVADDTQASGIFSAMDSALDHTYGRLAFDDNYFADYNHGSGVISSFVSNWEIRARLEKGDTNGALAIIEKLWGRMVVEGDYYSGAAWESLSPATGYPADDETSLAHAWGSGPTASLSKYVLGVRPVTAGFQTWLIQPQAGSLDWACGRVPTPYGPITFKWAKNDYGIPFHAELIVPEGTSGTLALPVISGATKVKVNGKTVKPKLISFSTLGDVTYLHLNNIGPGCYTIHVL